LSHAPIKLLLALSWVLLENAWEGEGAKHRALRRANTKIWYSLDPRGKLGMRGILKLGVN
jgi:hypothetical protein